MVHLKKKLLEQPTPLGITFPVVYSIWPLLILCANVWVFFSYNFQFSFWFSPSSYRRCVVDFGFWPFSIYSSSFLLLNFGFRLIELPGYIHYNLCALQPTTVDVPVRAHVCVCLCVDVTNVIRYGCRCFYFGWCGAVSVRMQSIPFCERGNRKCCSFFFLRLHSTQTDPFVRWTDCSVLRQWFSMVCCFCVVGNFVFIFWGVFWFWIFE